MTTLGITDTAGMSGSDLQLNVQYGCKFTMPVSGSVSTISIYMDGNGSLTDTQQVFIATVYDDDGADGDAGTLLGYTGEQTVLDAAAAAWVVFTFAAPIELAAGDFWFMVHCGASSKIGRMYGKTGSTPAGLFADVYAGGPLATAASTTNYTKNYAIYATYTPTAMYIPGIMQTHCVPSQIGGH